MKKNAINLSLGLILAVGSLSAHAAFNPRSTLTIEGNGVSTGSYFVMNPFGNSAYSLRFYITGHTGLVFRTIQPTGASHSGPPGGGETIATSIDNAWNYLSNTGLHFTIVAPDVISVSGNTAKVNFSGWTVTWNGIPAIHMGGTHPGGGPWGYLNPGTVWASSDTPGVATITFGTDGSNGDTYTLVHTATVPTDETGLAAAFIGAQYGVVLTGHVIAPASVPLPLVPVGTEWVLGSLLAGLGAFGFRNKFAA